MAETCIVCLGDLGENASAQPLPEAQLLHHDTLDALPDALHSKADSPAPKPKSPLAEDELIAHLLPCGHNLHDECLKPWVERANSCPICRQKFNQVDLVKMIDGKLKSSLYLCSGADVSTGPVVSSYPVQDRTQVAELDPSMLIDEEEDELESQPCRICGNDDHEEVLLLCDNCSVPHHTYCVELVEVPSGPWFCEDCALNRAIEASMSSTALIPTVRPVAAPSTTRRTMAQLRTSRRNVLERASDWARIWEQVRDRADLDLDFPYQDEDREVLRSRPRRRRHRQRGEDNIWLRRLQVAEQQGGAEQFRQIVPYVDSPTVRRPAPERQEPESLDEVIAWNALEKARDIDQDPSGRGRKRKSTTNSPASAERTTRKRRRTHSVSPMPAPPRPDPSGPSHPRKRPRTRRVQDVANAQPGSGEGTGAGASPNGPPPSAALTNGDAPSFLQTLLKEVENSAYSEDTPRGRPSLSIRANFDCGSPQASSPEASPMSSNHPSPRGSASPPPTARYSPTSPSLTSRIAPIYPRLGSPEILPPSIELDQARVPPKGKSRPDSESRTRQWVNGTDASSPGRSNEQSPTRTTISLSAKDKIQRFVRDALKEPYAANKINKDQYTEINRNVSRSLYDAMGEDACSDSDQIAEVRRLAGLEVNKAVTLLQPSRSPKLATKDEVA